MRIFLLSICSVLLNPFFLELNLAIADEAPAFRLQEPWFDTYAPADAKADYVMGYWSFDGGNSINESTGKKFRCSLKGAKINAQGKFGNCLESFPGYPKDSATAHYLLVTSDASLSSSTGALTLEMWINPNEIAEGDKGAGAVLLDKKYVDHTDYQLRIWQKDREGKRKLSVALGFGRESETWYSDAVVFEEDQWHHIAFTYDGKGAGAFFVNGYLQGIKTVEGRKKIVGGKKHLTIGDRNGANYMGFNGRLDQVRISNIALEFRPIVVTRDAGRNAFVRREGLGAINWTIRCLSRKSIANIAFGFSLNGIGKEPIRLRKPLKPGEEMGIVYPFYTELRADQYQLRGTVFFEEQIASKKREYKVSIAQKLILVNRKPRDQYPVVMWGAGLTEIDRLKEIGFTHSLGIPVNNGKILEAGEPTAAITDEEFTKYETTRLLDKALINGITFAPNLYPGRYAEKHREDWLRVDPQGKVLTGRYHNINGLNPAAQKYCYDVGKSVSQTFGDYPAYGAALVQSEIRDHAAPSFSKYDYDAFRKATGLEIPIASNNANAKTIELDLVNQPTIPAGAVSPHGVRYAKLNNFPKDRVIADDHPIYVYYRWYWKKGDGWNGLNSQIVKGLQDGLSEQKRKDFWTWNDPSVRVGSVYGSGGNVDYISQWSYCYPEPIRIGIATDELLAMAKGADQKQGVMKMTQIICYRDQIAPYPETYTKRKQAPPAYVTDWEREEADAAFPTLPPLMLREAFWTKFSRPIKGIMYHGWGSLVKLEVKRGYRDTHSGTQFELKRIIEEVVRPLGPTMLHVPGVQSDVAYLESFASQMFAGRGTWGWGHRWVGDVYLATMYAGLQPEMVFDETITQQGLKNYKVLFAIDCDVLTKSVVKEIQAFQKRGGIVIGDDHTCSAITPDVVLDGFQRTKNAQKDKQKLLKVAAQIRENLKGRYARFYDSSNPEVVPYRRRYKQADYLFAINDNREYGNYIGHHQLVMENGLPSKTELTLARKGRGHVYDLVKHRKLKVKTTGNQMVIPIDLKPCDGTVLLVTSSSIELVKIKTLPKAKRGQIQSVPVNIEITDFYNKPIEAVIPVQVRIEDASGREAEFSGYYAAIDGKLELDLDIAKNDPPGIWSIEVTELASGISAVKYLKVE